MYMNVYDYGRVCEECHLSKYKMIMCNYIKILVN